MHLNHESQSMSLSYIAQNLQAGNHRIKVQWVLDAPVKSDKIKSLVNTNSVYAGFKISDRQLRAIAYYY